MFACCCSSPDCLVNGCAQARQYRARCADPLRFGHATPSFQPAPLTEEDVRRILREEIERVLKYAPPAPPRETY